MEEHFPNNWKNGYYYIHKCYEKADKKKSYMVRGSIVCWLTNT